MSENRTPAAVLPPQTVGSGQATEPATAFIRNPSRAPRPTNTAQTTTPRDFGGATPKIGGILALRSENMTHKVNYDIFCEKLGIFIMNEFKGGENVIEAIKKKLNRHYLLFRK